MGAPLHTPIVHYPELVKHFSIYVKTIIERRKNYGKKNRTHNALQEDMV